MDGPVVAQDWGLSMDSPMTCTHWPLSCLSMRLSRPQSRSGCPSPEMSYLRPHGQCSAELEFGYKSRSLYCARGVELRMEGDTQTGTCVCPAPSTGLAWGGILGLLLALVVGRGCTSKSLLKLGEAPHPQKMGPGDVWLSSVE